MLPNIRFRIPLINARKFIARITRISRSLKTCSRRHGHFDNILSFRLTTHYSTHAYFCAHNHGCRSDSFKGFRPHHLRGKFDIPGIYYLKYQSNLREYRGIPISRYRKKSPGIRTMHKLYLVITIYSVFGPVLLIPTIYIYYINNIYNNAVHSHTCLWEWQTDTIPHPHPHKYT